MTLLLLLGIAPLLAAPSGVEGSVTSSITGAAIKKAVVVLRANRSAYQVLSDAAGHFQFADVAPGEYEVSAEAQGFLREPLVFIPSRRVVVAADQSVKDVAVRLTPLCAISGKVLDENGEPVAGAEVYTMRYRYRSGAKSLIGGESATSNHRGEYRIFDVEPGPVLLKYRKQLTPPSAGGNFHGVLPEMDYVPVFHPGVTKPAEAETLWVAPGAQLTGIDLRLRKVRVFHVRGRVTGVPFLQQPTVQDVDDTWSVKVRPDGQFDIGGFAPGRYPLAAAAGTALSPVQQVTVAGRDLDGLVFRIEPGAELTGAVEGLPAKVATIRIAIEAVGFGTTHNVAAANGSFTLPGVAPQTYRVTARTAEGLYLKAVHFGPNDVSATGLIEVTPAGGPLSLTFAADPGNVSGTVTWAAAGEMPITVSIAPTGDFERRTDWIQTTQLDDASGAFEFDDVPPGDYRILACETNDTDVVESPEFRKLLEGRSEAVTIHPREKASVRLKVVTAAEVDAAKRKLP